MSSWDLLDDKDEADLHKSRLLNVENKPFRRIIDRLTAITSIASQSMPHIKQESSSSSPSLKPAPTAQDLDHARQDITFDFAAFDATIHRIQSLHDANSRERDRYKTDQERILIECQAARANNALLREQLDGARATLAQRRKFDDMADKITSNRLLRPREDQLVSLAKLEEDCRELERESETYSATWRERRAQFNRIMEEGMMLRRQIRDEKEEVDRREGMNEGGDGVGDDVTPAPESRGGSPAPENGDKVANDDETPRPAGSNAGTPIPNMRDSPAPSLLRPNQSITASLSVSANGSRGPSRSVTPMPREERDDGDEEMGECADSHREMTDAGTPHISIGPPEMNGDRMDVDN